MSSQVNGASCLIQLLPRLQHVSNERMRLDVVEDEMDAPGVGHAVGDGVFGLVVEFHHTSLMKTKQKGGCWKKSERKIYDGMFDDMICDRLCSGSCVRGLYLVKADLAQCIVGRSHKETHFRSRYNGDMTAMRVFHPVSGIVMHWNTHSRRHTSQQTTYHFRFVHTNGLIDG